MRLPHSRLAPSLYHVRPRLAPDLVGCIRLGTCTIPLHSQLLLLLLSLLLLVLLLLSLLLSLQLVPLLPCPRSMSPGSRYHLRFSSLVLFVLLGEPWSCLFETIWQEWAQSQLLELPPRWLLLLLLLW